MSEPNNDIFFIIAVVAVILIVALIRWRKRSKPVMPQRRVGASPHKRELPADVQSLIARGHKLEAIKLVREYTRCSLAEAQAIVEAHLSKR